MLNLILAALLTALAPSARAQSCSSYIQGPMQQVAFPCNTAAKPLYVAYASTQAVVQTSAPVIGTNLPGYPITLDPAWTSGLALSTTSAASQLQAVALATTTQAGQIATLSLSTAANRSSINALGVSTGNIQAQANAIAVSTGQIYSALNSTAAALSLETSRAIQRENALGISTGNIQGQVNAVAVSTGSIYSALNSTASALTLEVARAIAREDAIAVSTGLQQVQIAALSLSTASNYAAINSTASALTLEIARAIARENAIAVSTGATYSALNSTASALTLETARAIARENAIGASTGTLYSIKASSGVNADITTLKGLTLIDSTITVNGALTANGALAAKSADFASGKATIDTDGNITAGNGAYVHGQDAAFIGNITGGCDPQYGCAHNLNQYGDANFGWNALAMGTDGMLTQDNKLGAKFYVGPTLAIPAWMGQSSGFIAADTSGTAEVRVGLVVSQSGQMTEVMENFGDQLGAYYVANSGSSFRMDTRSGQDKFSIWRRAAGSEDQYAALGINLNTGEVLIEEPTTGNALTLNGTMSATSYSGDGSALTGLPHLKSTQTWSGLNTFSSATFSTATINTSLTVAGRELRTVIVSSATEGNLHTVTQTAPFRCIAGSTLTFTTYGSGQRVLLSQSGSFESTNSAESMFGILLDGKTTGTPFNATVHIMSWVGEANNEHGCAFSWLSGALTAGSHTACFYNWSTAGVQTIPALDIVQWTAETK